MPGVIVAARRELDQLRAGTPGRRFRERFDAGPAPSLLARLLFGLGGLALIAAGIVMLIIPGPGLVGIFLGLGLLAMVSRPFATVFDACERAARRAWLALPASWRESRLAKAAFVIAISAGALVATLVAYYVVGRLR